MTKVKAIIQARMSSRRLPGKVLLPLGDDVVLGHVISRLRECKYVDDVIVATSTHVSDDAIKSYCDDNAVSCFRGDLEDVLARYYLAAKEASCDHVLRITADCPLIDPTIVDAVVMGHLAGEFDYYGLGGEFPDGLDCTVISFSALSTAFIEATLPSDREHVGPFIERAHDSKFRKGALEMFKGLSGFRLTLDQQEDYDLLKYIFEEAFPNSSPSAHEVIDLLRQREWLSAMNEHITRNEGYQMSLERDQHFSEG